MGEPLVASVKDRLQAMRSREAVNDTEAQGVRIAARISGKLRQRALREFKTGHRFFAKDYIVHNLKDVTTAAMMVSHLKGMKRSRQMVEQGGLKLAAPPVFRKVLDVLKRQEEVDYDKLQTQYQTQALKVLNDVGEEVESHLRSTISELIQDGTSGRKAFKILGEAFDAQGISPKNAFQLETIFRTQSQLAFSAGRWQADQDPDIQEILWGYTYVTVGDARVREEHAALDGTTLPKGDHFWTTFWTPNGWNCRCQIISVFDEREEQRPPTHDEDSEPIVPAPGFNYNPGLVFAA